jgi:meiotically up-regulated gene 157 (Mug157) protein
VRKDKEEAKTKNITDENDSFLWFLRAVDSALDLFHEVVGGNRFERFGRHIFFLFFCAVVLCWFLEEIFMFIKLLSDESKTKSNKI